MYPVTSKRACVKKGVEKERPAKFKGKAHNPKPSGSFYDPRRGGGYWSCRGWDRSVYPVTSKRACVKKVRRKEKCNIRTAS